MTDPPGILRIARILGEITSPNAVHTGVELPVIANRQHQVTVTRGERLVGNDIGVRRAKPLRRNTANEVIHILVSQPRDLCIVQRHLYVLTATVGLTPIQRGQDRAGRIHPGHDVGDGNADLLRPTSLFVRRSRDAHQAGRCLDHRIVTWLGRARAARSIRRDRTVNETGMCGEQRRRTQPEAIHRAHPEVLDKHVRRRDQLAHKRLTFRLCQVDGYRAFVPVCR